MSTHFCFIQPKEKGFIATLFYKNGNVKNIILEPETFKQCIESCEKFARNHLDIKYADLTGAWREYSQKQEPTPYQLKILQENSVCTYWMNKAQALIEIRKILAIQSKKNRTHKNIPTPAQKFFLERSGVCTENLSKQEAFVKIAKLKQELKQERKYT